MPLRLHSITFDCADPAALAGFWAAVTGYNVGTVNPFMADLGGDWPEEGGSFGTRMLFIKVPEGKAAKNRVHLDLGADDLEAEVERVLGLGAELVGRYDEWGVTWATFRDPEGNEFCVGHHPVGAHFVTRPDVTVTVTAPGAYLVVVGQGSTATEHRVRVPATMIDDLRLEGIDESTLVHESFVFLLEREPATSILSEFKLTVIGRYFPEYEQEIRRRLG